MSDGRSKRQGPPKYHRGGVRREQWIQRRAQFLYDRMCDDGKELYALVQPTPEEVKELLDDINMNPHIYTELLEGDLGFIAVMVKEERESRVEYEQWKGGSRRGGQ
jgi:hypothetical protein